MKLSPSQQLAIREAEFHRKQSAIKEAIAKKQAVRDSKLNELVHKLNNIVQIAESNDSAPEGIPFMTPSGKLMLKENGIVKSLQLKGDPGNPGPRGKPGKNAPTVDTSALVEQVYSKVPIDSIVETVSEAIDTDALVEQVYSKVPIDSIVETVKANIKIPDPVPGKQGPKGKPGLRGKPGPKGKQGLKGKDGKDAPPIDMKKLAEEVYAKIDTDPIVKAASANIDTDPIAASLKEELENFLEQTQNKINKRMSAIGVGGSGGGSYKILDNADVEFARPSDLTEDAILRFDINKKKFVNESFSSILSRIQTNVQAAVEVQYNRLIDKVDEFTYIGEAVPGTAKSAPRWRIKRVFNVEGSDDYEILWANGSASLDKIWNGRLSYSYS